MVWKFAIIKDITSDYKFDGYIFYDHHIKKPIPSNYGFGIIFTVDDKGKYLTIPSNMENKKRVVSFRISSYMGLGDANAKHYYGRFSVDSPRIKILKVEPSEKMYHKIGDIYSTNVMPKKCESLDFEVTRIAVKDEYGFNPFTGERRLETRKGRHTHGFDDLDSLKIAMNREFKRIFPKGWVLIGSHSNSIEKEFERFKGR